jgi:hypothetical protein
LEVEEEIAVLILSLSAVEMVDCVGIFQRGTELRSCRNYVIHISAPSSLSLGLKMKMTFMTKAKRQQKSESNLEREDAIAT